MPQSENFNNFDICVVEIRHGKILEIYKKNECVEKHISSKHFTHNYLFYFMDFRPIVIWYKYVCSL